MDGRVRAYVRCSSWLSCLDFRDTSKEGDSRTEARKAAKKEKKRIEKEKKAAEKEKERQKEKGRAEREAKKTAEKAERMAKTEAANLAAQAEWAKRKAQKKGIATATSSCKRIEILIASVQKTMRLPGATRIPEVQKTPLCDILSKLEVLHHEVQLVSTGRADPIGFTVPEREKTLSEAAKKHQALFAVAAKTYV